MKKVNDTLPLSGTMVLDLTHALAGPLATQRLAEMGAEVIKIESTMGGDFSRGVLIGELTSFGDSTAFVAMNRNKKSVSINLKEEEGKDIFYDLVTQADIVIQNYRPGVAERLGVDYKTLQEKNKKIVYVSISGYGTSGPMTKRPGQDLLLQSFCGMTYNGGSSEGKPVSSPLFIVDVSASHLATEAALAGLYYATKTGHGLESHISMIAAIMEVQLQEITTYLAHTKAPSRIKYNSSTIWMDPPYGIHNTKDGYLSMAQCDLATLAYLLKSPELNTLQKHKPKYEKWEDYMQWRDEVYDVLEKVLLEKSASEWDEYLNANAVWCMRVQDYEEFLNHEQTKDYLTKIEHYQFGNYHTVKPAIEFVGFKEPTLFGAPKYASHTKEVLLEKGVSNAKIAELLYKKVLYQSS